jgi:hypothetical protein
MPCIRNSLGKFTRNYEGDSELVKYQKQSEEPSFLYKETQLKMPSLSLMKIFKFILLIFLISPWVYIFVKKGNFKQLTGQISSYYDDQFSISVGGTCNATEVPVGNGKNKF